MSEKQDIRDDSALATDVPVGALDRTPVTFAPRADLTYRLIEGVSLSNASIHQSLLTGSVLRSSTLESIDLSRCDLDGMRIEDCVFVDCDFSNVDMRSCVLGNTIFRRCTFEGAYLSDCVFSGSELTDCSLRSSVVVDCSFSTCSLTSTDLSKSSLTQNRFSASRFVGMTLGDCTFLYSIMRDCSFVESKINAESVGMTFGLTREDIMSLGLMYLGKDQLAPPGPELISSLIAAYRRRRWYLGVMVMNLNFEVTSVARAIREYVNIIQQAATSGATLKRDELVFFAAVLSELARGSRLPLMSCLDAMETLSRLVESITSNPMADEAHTGAALQTLSSKLALIMHSSFDELDAQRIPLQDIGEEDSALVAFVFHERPDVELVGLLNELANVTGLPVLHESRSVEQRDGSYIEYIETTLLTLLSFQLFLFLLNGCVVQVTELKARWGVLTRKKPPPRYLQHALQPKQDLPSFLLLPMRNLVGHFLGTAIIDDPKLKGLAASNVIEARVERRSRRGKSGQVTSSE